MQSATTFEQDKTAILESLGLHGAEEDSETTECIWDFHPRFHTRNLPNYNFKKKLVWAEFKKNDYIFYTLKVKDTLRGKNRCDHLLYVISQVKMQKKFFEEMYGTIDGLSMEYEVTPSFELRMNQIRDQL
jgi:hypothetical protein